MTEATESCKAKLLCGKGFCAFFVCVSLLQEADVSVEDVFGRV